MNQPKILSVKIIKVKLEHGNYKDIEAYTNVIGTGLSCHLRYLYFLVAQV